MSQQVLSPARERAASSMQRFTTFLHAVSFVLGFSFIFVVLFGGAFALLSSLIVRYKFEIAKISGLIIILFGLLLVTGELPALMSRLSASFTTFDAALLGAGDVTFLIAIAGGLLSFLSPCVLPLVPAYIGYLSAHAVGHATVEPGSAERDNG